MRQFFMTSAAAAVLLGGAWAGVSAFAGDSGQSAGSSSAGAPARPPAAVPSAQASTLSVLGRPAAATVPSAVHEFAETPGAAAKYAPNARLARAANPAGSNGRPWFVVPGDDSVCLHVGEAGTCSPLGRVRAGKMALFSVPAPPPVPVVDGRIAPPAPEVAEAQARERAKTGTIRVMGVAPDGYTRVTGDAVGGEVTATIVDNVYEIEGAGLTNVRLHGSDRASLAVSG